MDKQYVVVKLITGETVMATFDGEDEKYIKIDFPVQIRSVLIPEINKESLSASPLCPFSDSTTFVLEKDHIVYIKKLHNAFVEHYKDFCKSYEEAMIPMKRARVQEHSADEMFEGFDDLDELTLEEIQNRLELLEAIASAPREELTEEELDKRVFVQGNDTKH
jgi:hypothetical protein